MREIKFRAWDNENKKMAENVCVFNGIAYPTPLKDSVGTKVMQYTGLLDKNRKEIYEGDIVFEEDGEYSKTVVIEWESEDARFFGKDIYTSDSFDIQEIDGVIIGNIYESKYLLDNIDTRV